MTQHRAGFIANVGLKSSSRLWAEEKIECPRRLEALNFLVIDDDEDDMEMIVDSLNNNMDVKQVTSALDAAKGVAALKSGEMVPDLIFLDINMPAMDGFEVQKILSEDPKLADIPIVFLTTSARRDDVLRALRGTAVRYIVKPDRFADLNDKTAEVIRLVINQKDDG